MATKRHKKGKGGFLRYANENRREKNKARRIANHMRRHPTDTQSAKREAGTPGVGNARRIANIMRHMDNAHLRRRVATAA